MSKRLIEAASDAAREIATEAFAVARQFDEETPPFIALFMRQGSKESIAILTVGGQDKQDVADGIATALSKPEVAVVALVTEAWMVRTKEPDVSIRPSAHPDRQECLLVSLQDQDDNRLMHMAPIIDGSLGEWDLSSDECQGRFFQTHAENVQHRSN